MLTTFETTRATATHKAMTVFKLCRDRVKTRTRWRVLVTNC